jgi:hypothetical protein
VRVPPEGLGKHPGRLHGRRLLQVADQLERPDREAPGPTISIGIPFRLAGDLDNAKERLPDRRVEDGQLARLHTRPFRRRVSRYRRHVDRPVERPVAAAADEQPVRQSRSITPAIAWP